MLRNTEYHFTLPSSQLTITKMYRALLVVPYIMSHGLHKNPKIISLSYEATFENVLEKMIVSFYIIHLSTKTPEE